jgi:uncharacterized protein (DUF427 family)
MKMAFKENNAGSETPNVPSIENTRWSGSSTNPAFSTTDLHNIINISRDARNIIIARQQERVEVEAYSPTNYHIPQEDLRSTQKRKTNTPNATTEQPTRSKKTSTS